EPPGDPGLRLREVAEAHVAVDWRDPPVAGEAEMHTAIRVRAQDPTQGAIGRDKPARGRPAAVPQLNPIECDSHRWLRLARNPIMGVAERWSRVRTSRDASLAEPGLTGRCPVLRCLASPRPVTDLADFGDSKPTEPRPPAAQADL